MPGTPVIQQCAGAPRPRPVVVAFVSGKGGVGTTTTAAGVALALAHGSTGPTAATSIRSGPGSLHHRLVACQCPRLAAPAPEPPMPVAVAGPGARAWLTVADSGPWCPWGPDGDVVSLVGRLRGTHPLTIVDIGDAPGDAAHRVLARADRVVLVTTPTPDAVGSMATAFSRVRQIDPARLAAVVVAVVCLDARQQRWAGRRLRSTPVGTRATLVPFDPAVAARALPDPARARPWRAYQRIAGLLSRGATVRGVAVSR